MSRTFLISDLRTLTARALEVGNYKPAGSGRIRAVPDTRTIRYYTTLGLIDRPAEIRGRTAFYEKRHVMQLVAIKRLQAMDLTLSDIQARIVGITPSQLKKLADLPKGFWKDADAFLTQRSASSKSPEPKIKSPERSDFWTAPAALPRASQSQNDSTSCVRFCVGSSVQVIVDTTEVGSIDMSRVRAAAIPLLKELVQQGVLPEYSVNELSKHSLQNDSSQSVEDS
ncbi:MAG: MerR family transcriptional regulator [Planctomycetota bacterium]